MVIYYNRFQSSISYSITIYICVYIYIYICYIPLIPIVSHPISTVLFRIHQRKLAFLFSPFGALLGLGALARACGCPRISRNRSRCLQELMDAHRILDISKDSSIECSGLVGLLVCHYPRLLGINFMAHHGSSGLNRMNIRTWASCVNSFASCARVHFDIKCILPSSYIPGWTCILWTTSLLQTCKCTNPRM